MEEHWHNVYVSQTTAEAVKVMRANGFGTDYDPRPENPENANGYIEKNLGVISSCVRWRTNAQRRNEEHEIDYPESAMSCFQLLSSADDFPAIVEVVKSKFNVVKDCGSCTKTNN